MVIALVTLIPADGRAWIVPGRGPARDLLLDIGGPAPEGFWVFTGGQRLLNTALFVPAGALLAWPPPAGGSAGSTVPLGLVLLAAYSRPSS